MLRFKPTIIHFAKSLLSWKEKYVMATPATIGVNNTLQ